MKDWRLTYKMGYIQISNHGNNKRSQGLKKVILFISIICLCAQAYGQHKENKRDSTVHDSIIAREIYKDSTRNDSMVHYKAPKDSVVSDSTKLYEEIKKYSKRSKITKTLHKWIFRRRRADTVPKKRIPAPDYSPYKGRTIRHIEIKTYDPFGYSVIDSTKKPQSKLEETGNTLHIKSKENAIRKFVLFKEGQVLDTLKIYETARLLRNQGYVHEVQIVPRATELGKDSLDLVVKVRDSWSLLPKGQFSGSHLNIGFLERNFMGMGHRAEVKYSKRYSDGNSGFESFYTIPNFKNSFIDITGKYAFNLDYFHDKYLSINREFYSPLTRWAGGAFIQERSLERPMLNDTLGFTDKGLKYFYQDYWLGRAFHIFKGASEKDRTTSLIVGLRAYFLNYRRRPSPHFDPESYFSDEHFFLGSIGISSRQYVHDRFIFSDGEIEDVPVGRLFSITSGMQRKNQKSRLYLGMRAAYGKYFNWGLLSGNFEMGSFFSAGHSQQTAMSFKLNYFTRLLELGGSWKMRQFIKPQFVIGWNRKPSDFDRVGLNDRSYYSGVNSYNYLDYEGKARYLDYKNGNIQGFDSWAHGTRKYVLSLQTQFYSPWDLIGFRLNPFINVSLGYIADKPQHQSFGSNKTYSSFSVGFIIRNDYLVFDSFQLSLSFYPSMPGNGDSVLKTNGVRVDRYGFQGFQPGEPRPVIYE